MEVEWRRRRGGGENLDGVEVDGNGKRTEQRHKYLVLVRERERTSAALSIELNEIISLFRSSYLVYIQSTHLHSLHRVSITATIIFNFIKTHK